MKRFLIVTLLFLFFSQASIQAEIVFIPERDYLEVVHEELLNAKESIEVEMYLAYIKEGKSSGVEQLARDLVRAKEKGVKVDVTLEGKKSVRDENSLFYKYLEKAGINVRYDSPDYTTHSKKILIDSRRLIIGSSNWTGNALNGKNHESNVIVDVVEDKACFTILEDRDYAKALLEAIRGAREDINVIMYSFDFSWSREEEKTVEVLKELLRAQARGVRVRILLDSWVEEDVSRNECSFYALRQGGVEVSYDSGTIATHNKLVIIDTEKVFLGSHNWTENALSSNHESSILIESKDLAQRFSRYIIKIYKEIPPPQKALKVKIPESFITKEDGALRDMFVHQASRAFKLYTLFLYETARQNSQEIKIDYEDWYRRSSRKPPSRIDNSRRIRNLHRTAVRDSIYYLRKKGLVKFEPYKGVIEVLDIEDDNYIHVPEEFWEYNWSGLLSTRATYFYFINLAEFKESSIKPFWFASQPMLSSKYFISDRALGLAAKELMRYNLIEIRHDIPDPGQAFWDRKANRYFINPLYNPEELEICWQELEKRHGEYTIKPGNRPPALMSHMTPR